MDVALLLLFSAWMVGIGWVSRGLWEEATTEWSDIGGGMKARARRSGRDLAVGLVAMSAVATLWPIALLIDRVSALVAWVRRRIA